LAPQLELDSRFTVFEAGVGVGDLKDIRTASLLKIKIKIIYSAPFLDFATKTVDQKSCTNWCTKLTTHNSRGV